MVHLLAVVQPPGPAINLNVGGIVTVVGVAIALVTNMLTHPLASKRTKSILTLVLSGLVGVGTYLGELPKGLAIKWQAMVLYSGLAFVLAIAGHYGFWKPTGTTGFLDQWQHGFGGPKPPKPVAAPPAGLGAVPDDVLQAEIARRQASAAAPAAVPTPGA